MILKKYVVIPLFWDMMLHHRLTGYRRFGDVSQKNNVLSYTADRTPKLAKSRNIKRTCLCLGLNPQLPARLLFYSEQASDHQ